MPVADKDVATQGDGHGGRPIKSVWAIAGDPRLAERHQNLPVRAKLENLLALSIFSLGVSCPHISVPIHKDAVRNHEHPRAEAFYQLAGMIKFEDRRFGPARAVFPPHLSATQTLPSRSKLNWEVCPQVLPSGIFAQPSIVRYGLGRELGLAWEYAIPPDIASIATIILTNANLCRIA